MLSKSAILPCETSHPALGGRPPTQHFGLSRRVEHRSLRKVVISWYVVSRKVEYCASRERLGVAYRDDCLSTLIPPFPWTGKPRS
jgi:hypothetical protein